MNESSAPAASLVLCERIHLEGHIVALLTLNRPEQRNPINFSTIVALNDAISELGMDRDVGAIIITGAGGTFSAGGDLKGYQELYRNPDQFQRFLDAFRGVCDHLERLRTPTVAMVNGICVAGGLELALACDFVTISESARIGDGHLRFGQLPGAGGSQRLVRAIGQQRARRWLLSGELFEASEAVACGLAIATFPDAILRQETLAMLLPILAYSPLATARMKDLIRTAMNSTLEHGLNEEQAVVHDYAVNSFDAAEGINAFAERRTPVYRSE
jgi:enoyl-CoA hydratase/carnithine racemase